MEFIDITTEAHDRLRQKGIDGPFNTVIWGAMGVTARGQFTFTVVRHDDEPCYTASWRHYPPYDGENPHEIGEFFDTLIKAKRACEAKLNEIKGV